MPGVATFSSVCYGIDYTARGTPSWGIITMTKCGNIIAEGRPVATFGDIATAATGGSGFVMSMFNNVLVEGSGIATQWSMILGPYTGIVISGAETVRVGE